MSSRSALAVTPGHRDHQMGVRTYTATMALGIMPSAALAAAAAPAAGAALNGVHDDDDSGNAATSGDMDDPLFISIERHPADRKIARMTACSAVGNALLRYRRILLWFR
jgi:hypothetical protein